MVLSVEEVCVSRFTFRGVLKHRSPGKREGDLLGLVSLSQPLFLRSMPGVSFGFLFCSWGSPWVYCGRGWRLVRSLVLWPAFHLDPCALGDVRAVFVSWIRGPPIFL